MNNNLELYIHIPFCVRKCNYCDFLSAPGTDEQIEIYVNSLIKEIKNSKEQYGSRSITSIYFGGGTPSILTPEQFSRIAEALSETFAIKDGLKDRSRGLKGKEKGLFKRIEIPPAIEFSVECNPKTLDKNKLKVFKKAGVNRISIGCQSVSDKELQALGRIHTVSDFLSTFNLVRDMGFENVNVDLMQAIPHQTIGSWKKGLIAICALRPEHISAYSLIIEEGTPFYEAMNSDKPLPLPSEDEEREIYHATKEILEAAGYKRYEISNYALEGYSCRHNEGYWRRADYLGLGLGSSSKIGNTRWKNTSDMLEYISGGDIRREVEELSVKDAQAEFMFLGLRMSSGVSKEAFIDEFGIDYDLVYGDVTRKFIKEGLLKIEELDKTYVRLTDKGVDLSNRVFAEFLQD